jgi:hypothetical protein
MFGLEAIFDLNGLNHFVLDERFELLNHAVSY